MQTDPNEFPFQDENQLFAPLINLLDNLNENVILQNFLNHFSCE